MPTSRALLLALPALALVAAAPPLDLSGTELYSATVRGCRTVDLATWQHPTRAVLRAAGVRLAEVQLCNDSQFPVFKVALPYAVDGPNDTHLNRLYADLARANGFWSYALVDTASVVAITVTVDPTRRTISPSYEDFQE